MTDFRFVHAGDLHLGRRFANIPEPADGNVRGRLMEARHGVIGRLAEAARDHGAGHVLLAGDTFDTTTPSNSTRRQALTAMAEAGSIHWWILPGNHDNLREAEPLWQAIAAEAAPNVHPLVEAAPVEVATGVWLLPCPVEWRATGRDPSAALTSMTTPEGALRIGLAHGGVTDFTGSGESIPPDRDRSARLDYLALGDWHGRMEVAPRVQYSGTPEQDRFKHADRGVCLAVSLRPDTAPTIRAVETGRFLWTEIALPLSPRQDAAAALRAVLPDGIRRDILCRVRASGWAALPDRAALEAAADAHAPDFAHFELDTSALETRFDASDIEEIDRTGALRHAAATLMNEARSDTLPKQDREIAGDALARLYSYVAGRAE